MKTVLTAVKLVLSDLSKLAAPAIATALAGLVAPIVAAVAGATITAPEVGGWLLVVGAIAATLQNLLSGRAAAARTPAKASK